MKKQPLIRLFFVSFRIFGERNYMLIEGGTVGVFALMISSFILDDEVDRAYRTL